MSASSLQALYPNATPEQLRSLVLDYLYHNYYTKTISQFSTASSVRHLDADGDELVTAPSSPILFESDDGPAIQRLAYEVKKRREIRHKILSGEIDEAIKLLNAYFPAVLREGPAPPTTESAPKDLRYLSSTSTDPAHLLLNLRILAFCEACRTVPLVYPPPTSGDEPERPTTLTRQKEDDGGDDEATNRQQMDLLTRARKLWAFAQTLPNQQDRATYDKELKNVAGLLAYENPEESPMSKYLAMERREAVADQINRAILKHSGLPLISSLELLIRHINVLWEQGRQQKIKPRSDAVVLPPRPPHERPEDSDGVVPAFDLRLFLSTKP